MMQLLFPRGRSAASTRPQPQASKPAEEFLVGALHQDWRLTSGCEHWQDAVTFALRLHPPDSRSDIAEALRHVVDSVGADEDTARAWLRASSVAYGPRHALVFLHEVLGLVERGGGFSRIRSADPAAPQTPPKRPRLPLPPGSPVASPLAPPSKRARRT